jgi:hypothetical protein
LKEGQGSAFGSSSAGLRPLGFSGGLSILKEYLHGVRMQASAKRAYVRMASLTMNFKDFIAGLQSL